MCRLLMCSLLRCARWGLFLPLLCLLVLLPAATCSASEMPEPVYQITETELTELQSNLTRLQLINDSLQQTCGRQKNQIIDLQTSLAEAQRRLAAAQKQQTALQLQIRTLTENSQKQEALLTEANKSFEMFAKEEKARRLRIKAQRNTWAAAAGILAAGLALK